jgi:RNA polymerase sigma-70 factor (ECF subfamily)
MTSPCAGLMLVRMSDLGRDLDRYADLDEVYRDNVVPLYRFVYSKVGNRADAEDLTAEVFLAAIGPLRLTAHRAEVRAYLFAAARTVLARFWRKRLRGDATIALPDVAAPGDRAGVATDQPLARELLASLPDRYRRILELRFLDSCSIKEAARALDVTVANTKVLQHRALVMAARMSTTGRSAGGVDGGGRWTTRRARVASSTRHGQRCPTGGSLVT